jgi:tRNA threonylcarbamoyladenosine biosynthesis protein TsaE
MATFISHSPQETMAFGEQLGRQATSGLVFGLIGDLGAGKTQFVKGFARGLSVTEPVLSPTFALLHLYTSGRLPLYHIDFYRLDNSEQILGAGLAEYFSPAGVAVIEWWDRWRDPPPTHLREVRFETLNETERRITYDDPGH